MKVTSLRTTTGGARDVALGPTSDYLGNSSYCTALGYGTAAAVAGQLSTNTWTLPVSNWWDTDANNTQALDCGGADFWLGLQAAQTAVTGVANFDLATINVTIDNEAGAYWTASTTANNVTTYNGVCAGINGATAGTDAPADRDARRGYVKNCCMNSADLASFVHCMNFRSTPNLSVAAGGYLRYWDSLLTAGANATPPTESTACKDLKNKGLNWLDETQLNNWDSMCDSSDLYGRFKAKLQTDMALPVAPATGTTLDDFTTNYAPYWSQASTAGETAWFNSTADNLWGSKSACSVTYADDAVSVCTVSWAAVGGVQAHLLDDDAQTLLT